LGQASSAVSNSYNPSRLMMGAAAYIVLFPPVVVARRRIEAKFAPSSTRKSWKRRTRSCPRACYTILLSLLVVPLGLVGGLTLAVLASSVTDGYDGC